MIWLATIRHEATHALTIRLYCRLRQVRVGVSSWEDVIAGLQPGPMDPVDKGVSRLRGNLKTDGALRLALHYCRARYDGTS